MAQENHEAAEVLIKGCDGERKAVVRMEYEGMSVCLGRSHADSVRIWFDSMDDLGFMDMDGKQVARIRDSDMRTVVKTACEAAMWEYHTGARSGLCDGHDDWHDMSFISMEDM